MTARDSLSQVRFSAFGQQFAAEASRPQRRRKICQTLFIGFAPWFAFLTGAAERAKRQSKFNVMPLIYGKPSSRQAVKPHFLCFFWLFLIQPSFFRWPLAVLYTLYIGGWMFTPCPILSFHWQKQPSSGGKSQKITEKLKKIKKNRIFSTFFCWFFLQIH